MLLRPNGQFQLQCDMCGVYSDIYNTYEDLIAGTNFGKSLYEEPAGWCNARPPLQIEGTEATLSDEYGWHRGAIDSETHLCFSCRGLSNMYFV
jgi:hypothetical protein